MKPVPGSVAVVHADAGWRHNLDAYAIQIGTQSRFNHCAIVSRVILDRITVVEAMGRGVRERVLHADELPHWRFEADPTISTAQRLQIVQEAERLIGTPYDYTDIAKFLVRFLVGRVTTEKKDYADDRVVCSELVAWCLHVAGINPWPTTAFGAVSPGDVAEWMFATNHTYG